MFLVGRLDGPSVREVFEICIEDIAAEIDKANDKGCDGNCFWCENENCNSRQEKRENCIYDSTKKCNIYKAHEVAIENGKDCKSFCCNACKENECIAKCSYARGEKTTENKDNKEKRKSVWEKGIFENDGEGYGWWRSEMIRKLFTYLHEYALDVDGIGGELVTGPGNKKRDVFISEDEKYVEFYKCTDGRIKSYKCLEGGDEELDFKVSIERLKDEYNQYCKDMINTSDEKEELTVITEDTVEIEREIAIEIVEGMVEDNSKDEVENIIKTAVNLEKYIREQFDNDAWSWIEHKGEFYEWQTCPNDKFLYVYKIKSSTGGRTGKYFKDTLSAFVLMVISEYVEKYKADIQHDKLEEEVVEAEVITELPMAAEEVIKDIQYNGCTGMDKDGESYTCPPRRVPCDKECKWQPTGITIKESRQICNECWWKYVRELIEKDRKGELQPAAGEIKVHVYPNTIEQQQPLPRLKNNNQRKSWIENFESWGLWIENKETQERFFRYTFENGDAFVIRQAFSTRAHWNYISRQMEKNPHWSYRKEYIVKKGEDLTLADCETNTTQMVEYLKELQK